ncbi:MAG: metallophosphoesterase [Romboutsia sp.]|uniref:metallophosphoesterase n=1 Tax=Terrisporobacter sp. TaxID=1965305 RepID=UPI002FCC827E
MSIYAIGDLHFSTAVNKPMDIFGGHWDNHQNKIIENWKEVVTEEDTVLVLGDTSWAISMTDAKEDLDIINDLPGKKIFIKGNHDYWWTSLSKLKAMYSEMVFLQNTFYKYGNMGICGSRGWLCPNEVKFDKDDEKIYKREKLRIKMSLDAAIKSGCDELIVITHYPPTNDKLEESEFTKLFEEYNVKKVIYGHLHGKDSFEMGLRGIRNDIEYILASSDYIDFKPIKILE